MRAGPAPEPASLRTIVAEDAQGLAEEAGSLVLSLLTRSLEERGRATLILAGGATPRRTYAFVAVGIMSGGIPVARLAWLFGDERWVPRDDPRSNEGMARETLLGPIRAPEETIHSWRAGVGDPVDCARRYASVLAEVFGEPGDRPDVLLLGIGADGHTASLFPGATAYLPDGRHVGIGPSLTGGGQAVTAAAVLRGGAGQEWRLTLAPDFLRTSRHVVFIAAGADKAGALRRARQADADTPAAWIRGATTHFVVTREALGPEEPGAGGVLRA